jgi:hypothetical protein
MSHEPRVVGRCGKEAVTVERLLGAHAPQAKCPTISFTGP